METGRAVLSSSSFYFSVPILILKFFVILQSLSLDAVANMHDSEPDYDIPRPHASLLQILPQSSRIFPGAPDDEMKATHFFSRPESPR